MVKNSSSSKLLLNNIFHSLSDPTRRKILERLAHAPLTISQIKKPYKVSFVAISKHLKVLERSSLVRRQRIGREHVFYIRPLKLRQGYKYLSSFQKIWRKNLSAVERFLERNS